jgi:hypothetical protein
MAVPILTRQIRHEHCQNDLPPGIGIYPQPEIAESHLTAQLDRVFTRWATFCTGAKDYLQMALFRRDDPACGLLETTRGERSRWIDSILTIDQNR